MSTHWLFAAGVGLLMAAVAFATYRTGQMLRDWTPPANLMLSLPDNLVRLGLAGLCILLGRGLGPGPAALGWPATAAHLGADLAVGAAVGLMLAGLLDLGGHLVVQRWGPEVYSTRMLQCILPASRAEWGGVLLALLPAAALEELLFRSLPLGGLGWLLASAWLLWPLALCFGLLHWPQGGWGVVGTTLAALALSWLFLATRSIWAPLAAHYVMNLVQLLLAKRLGLAPLRGEELAPYIR